MPTTTGPVRRPAAGHARRPVSRNSSATSARTRRLLVGTAAIGNTRLGSELEILLAEATSWQHRPKGSNPLSHHRSRLRTEMPGCAGSTSPRSRRSAPEVLITAETQRWTPEEVLRTLVEAELAARDASNVADSHRRPCRRLQPVFVKYSWLEIID
jgi:hypothetical protein